MSSHTVGTGIHEAAAAADDGLDLDDYDEADRRRDEVQLGRQWWSCWCSSLVTSV